METKQAKAKFSHGTGYEAAKEYLKEVGKYDDVIEKAPLGGQPFEIIIAANCIWDANNKTTEEC